MSKNKFAYKKQDLPQNLIPSNKTLDVYDKLNLLYNNASIVNTNKLQSNASPTRFNYNLNEGQPNIDNINFTQRMRNERKGQIISLISSINKGEISIPPQEKEKILIELEKCMKNLTEKPCFTDESKDPSIKRSMTQKVENIDALYFGKNKRHFIKHPCLNSSVDLKMDNNYLGLSEKIISQINYYLNQSKIDYNLKYSSNFKPVSVMDSESEYLKNYEKIRFNFASKDSPFSSEKKPDNTLAQEENYTIIKFGDNNNQNNYKIKLVNYDELKEERFNKLKILNNLNKNSNYDPKMKYNLKKLENHEKLNDYRNKLVEIKQSPKINKNSPKNDLKHKNSSEEYTNRKIEQKRNSSIDLRQADNTLKLKPLNLNRRALIKI